MSRETSRDYRSPHRPLSARVLNSLWGSVGRPWLMPLEADAWLSAAMRAEGIQTLPAPWNMEPFDVLAESLREEADLHPLGRFIVYTRIVNGLRARIRTTEELQHDPYILDRFVDKPIFIIGLQHTGTTLLHHLLAAPPGHRAMRSWEALNPAPFPGEKDTELRIRAAENAAMGVEWLAPDFHAAHPAEPTLPEDEVIVLEQVGLTTGFEATLRVPRFASWLEGIDQTPGYRWLYMTLQYLQGTSKPTWILQSPHHLEFLETLFSVFPDARLIWTHRDPVATLPSFCSMVAHGHGLCSDSVHPEEIGQHWLRKTTRMIDLARRFRQNNDVPIHDVRYEALVKDPLKTVAGIFDFLGAPFSEETRAMVENRRREHPRSNSGPHRFAAEDFGLSEEKIATAFAAYRAERGWT